MKDDMMSDKTGYNCSPERIQSQTGAFIGNHNLLTGVAVIAIVAAIALPNFVNLTRNQRKGCCRNLAGIASGIEKESPECPVESCAYEVVETEGVRTVKCSKGSTHFLFDLYAVKDRTGWRFVQDLPETLPMEKTVITDSEMTVSWDPAAGRTVLSATSSFWKGKGAGSICGVLAAAFIGLAIYSIIVFVKEKDGYFIFLLVLYLGLTGLMVFLSVRAFAGTSYVIADSTQGRVTVGTGYFGKEPDPGELVKRPLAFTAFRLESGSPLLYFILQDGGKVSFSEIGPVSDENILMVVGLLDNALQKKIAEGNGELKSDSRE